MSSWFVLSMDFCSEYNSTRTNGICPVALLCFVWGKVVSVVSGVRVLSVQLDTDTTATTLQFSRNGRPGPLVVCLFRLLVLYPDRADNTNRLRVSCWTRERPTIAGWQWGATCEKTGVELSCHCMDSTAATTVRQGTLFKDSRNATYFTDWYRHYLNLRWVQLSSLSDLLCSFIASQSGM